MKFKVNTKDFLNIANNVAKGISNKGELCNSIFEIIEENGIQKLLMTVRSQTSFFKGKVNLIDTEIMEEGIRKWGVEGFQFKQILSVINNFQTETLTFEMEDSERMFNIRSGENLYRLSVFEAPILQTEEEITNICTLSGQKFNETLGHLIKLCSNVSAMAEHPSSCIHIYINNESLTAMSTNTISLAELKLPITDFENEVVKLIKPTQAIILMSSFSPDEIIRLIKTDTMLGYIDSNETIKLVSVANFEPLFYDPIKGLATDEQVAIINKDDLRLIVDSLSKICVDNDEVQFVMENNSIFIHSTSGDKFKLNTESQFEFTKMKMMKTPLSSLFGIMSDKVRMCWTNKAKQRLIKFENLDKEDNIDTLTFMGIATNDSK